MIIAFPTETFYGLGCNPFDAAAVDELCALKSRGVGDGFPLVIDKASRIEEWIAAESAEVKAEREKLVNQYWPGPLTLVFAANDAAKKAFAEAVFGPDFSLAVRLSPRPETQELAARFNGALIATSANPHGSPPPKTATDVKNYFSDLKIIDGGETPGGKPSTLVDVRTLPFKIIRQGAIVL